MNIKINSQLIDKLIELILLLKEVNKKMFNNP